MASGLLARTEEWRGALARRTSAGALWPRLSAWVETSLIVLGLLGQFFSLRTFAAAACPDTLSDARHAIP